MAVGEVVAGPAEELDGGSGGGVGELEDVLDVRGGEEEAGVGEGGLEGGGGGGGEDFAEVFGFWGEIGDIEVGVKGGFFIFFSSIGGFFDEGFVRGV